MRERKETCDNKIQVGSKCKSKKSIPHQSIDDIRSINNRYKLMQKNKHIEDMLMNNTPTINYWTLKSEEKIPKPKLKSKTSGNINSSKRSINSTSKSRSSAKGVNKDFNRLITKSKLRLSGNISKPESATGKYSTIASDMKMQKLEEVNFKLATENELLRSENGRLKEKLNMFLNCNIDQILEQYPVLAKSAEEMEELYAQTAAQLVQEREA